VGEFEDKDVKTSGSLQYKSGEEVAALRSSIGGQASSITLALAFTIKEGVTGNLPLVLSASSSFLLLIVCCSIQFGRAISDS